MAAASAAASRSGTRRAVRPSTTTELMPPAFVVTTGVAEESDSSRTLGRPSTLPESSRTDGTTATSEADSQSATWSCGKAPRNTTRSPTPLETARWRSSASRSPCPTMNSRRLGHRSTSAATASIKYSNPFLWTSLPTVTSTGSRSPASCSQRILVRASGSGLNRSVFTPYGMTSVLPASAPRVTARRLRSSLHAVIQLACRNAKAQALPTSRFVSAKNTSEP